MTDTPDLGELHVALKEAQEKWEEANRKAEVARRLEALALNNLNDIQKTFKAAVAEIRQQAPNDSDWGAERREKWRAA